MNCMISSLKNVYDLDISFCRKVNDLNQLAGNTFYRRRISSCDYDLKGYEALEGIPLIRLGHCNISDLSYLRRSKSVILQNCEELVDVSPLKFLEQVTIDECKQVTDISMFGNVIDLTIEALPCLKHFPIPCNTDRFRSSFQNYRPKTIAIGGSERSYTSSFPSSDYKFLEDVECLRLFRFDQIYDFGVPFFHNQGNHLIDGLQYLHSLQIACCAHLSDVNGLGRVHIIL